MTKLELEKKVEELTNKIDSMEHWMFCLSNGIEYCGLNMDEVLDKLDMEPVYPDVPEDYDEDEEL